MWKSILIAGPLRPSRQFILSQHNIVIIRIVEKYFRSDKRTKCRYWGVFSIVSLLTLLKQGKNQVLRTWSKTKFVDFFVVLFARYVTYFITPGKGYLTI